MIMFVVHVILILCDPFFRSTSSSGSTGCAVARALYNFTSENSNELSITAGDELVSRIRRGPGEMRTVVYRLRLVQNIIVISCSVMQCQIIRTDKLSRAW